MILFTVLAPRPSQSEIWSLSYYSPCLYVWRAGAPLHLRFQDCSRPCLLDGWGSLLHGRSYWPKRSYHRHLAATSHFSCTEKRIQGFTEVGLPAMASFTSFRSEFTVLAEQISVLKALGAVWATTGDWLSTSGVSLAFGPICS